MLKKISMKGISVFDLKIIGIVFMFIDHIHEMFVPMGIPHWFDWFGRPVATLFFFISVEAFSHTHNKKLYLLRLYIGMVVMSFGSLLFQKMISYNEVQIANNIFSDLCAGAVMMYGIDIIYKGYKSKNVLKTMGGVLLLFLPILFSFLVLAVILSPNRIYGLVLLTSFLPAIVTTENYFMVFLIPLLYLFKGNRMIQCLLIAIASIIYLFSGSTQWIMIFSIIPILLYNGTKGKGMKYFFYIFYPAHIWILYIISALCYYHWF